MKLLSLLLIMLNMAVALELGKVPTHIYIEGERGAQINGDAFSSKILKDKVYVLFYVDPDEKEMNEHVSTALKAEKFDRHHYGSVAVINMAATWLPNFAIASKLKKKQEKYPDTLYVKDLQSVLVKEWDLADDSSNVLLFDKNGKLIFLKEGKLSDTDVTELISLVKAKL